MDAVFSILPLHLLLFAGAIAFLAGAVKGAVGFGMPMIMISCLSIFLEPDLALAILILPTLFSNGIQSFRQGIFAALTAVKKFGVFLSVGFVFLVASAQLVTLLEPSTLFLIIGSAVTCFAGFQLSGWSPKIPQGSAKIEAAIAAFAGSIGGVSGVWGPPTVAYLTAINTPKEEQLRVQGVIYGLGSIALLLAHLRSGVITSSTLPLALGMVIPALIGMSVGYRWQKSVDQATFKKVTLIVLIFGGLNLLRRGVMG